MKELYGTIQTCLITPPIYAIISYLYNTSNQIEMWKYFTARDKSQNGQRGTTSEEEQQSHFRQLKNQLQQQIKTLTQQFQSSQYLLSDRYSVSPREETLTNTLHQLITTIQGLVSIVQELRAEYQEVQQLLQEHSVLKHKLDNHQNIITDLQDSHSQQVTRIYEQRSKNQDKLKAQIECIMQQNQRLEQELSGMRVKIEETTIKMEQMQMQLNRVRSNAGCLESKKGQIELKYHLLTSDFEVPEYKKVIDIDNMKLQYLFYYNKFKNSIINFLDIKDLTHLQQTNKFFNRTLKKQQPKRSYTYFKKVYEKHLTYQIKNAKLYEKIYELFPSQNIKINAFKYLHFRIKPATYILPYLQEEQIELIKKDQGDDKEKQGGKFSWRSIFNSDKNVKNDKKQESRFSLSALKNQEEFKKIECKIENTFKNILHVKMPQDLHYFSENMEKQLQQLKQDMGISRQGKGGQVEWTSQLYCLSRYMYHQISQLYNLLQVIFGQLVKKNKEVLSLTQGYEYLKENQLVLRNLIQNLSTDKTTIEKKYLYIENDILKKNLEKQAAHNNWQKIKKQHDKLKQKYDKLQQEYILSKQVMEKYGQERRGMQNKLSLIRQELDVLDRIPSKIRKDSIGSVNSQEFPAQDISTK